MNRIAQFFKVSKEQFIKDVKNLKFNLADKEIEEIYNNIQLPTRSTEQSAGNDFKSPFTVSLHPGESIIIPTGIRAKIDDGYVLMIFPRSSLGFKYRMQLDNTCGIIDADYYYGDNEGHIMCKISNQSNDSEKVLTINFQDKFCQGIFIPFGITIDDKTTTKRTGGIGSTGK
ncbi:MAG: deoxyuridine 5'-triphosphate nucleotidohydrolase [Clostridia bacterium]|nr:deoxyuridine 5'-triphosphate nucleotidohydrolase [Clostridia bacterium]